MLHFNSKIHSDLRALYCVALADIQLSSRETETEVILQN